MKYGSVFAGMMTTAISVAAFANPIEMPAKPDYPDTPSGCSRHVNYYRGGFDVTWNNLRNDWQLISDRQGLWEAEMCDNHFDQFFVIHKPASVTASSKRIRCRQMGKRAGYYAFKDGLGDFCDAIIECSDDGIQTGEDLGQEICSIANGFPFRDVPDWLCNWQLRRDCRDAANDWVAENCYDAAVDWFGHAGLRSKINNGCRVE